MQIYKSGKLKGQIRLGQVLYTGFTIGQLPNKFAYIFDEYTERDGITKWFNYRGLTFIPNYLLS